MKGVKLGYGMYYIKCRLEKFFATYRHPIDADRKISKVFATEQEARNWLLGMTSKQFEEVYNARVLPNK